MINVLSKESPFLLEGRPFTSYHSYIVLHYRKNIKASIDYGLFYGKRKPDKIMDVHYKAVFAEKKRKVYKAKVWFLPKEEGTDNIINRHLSEMTRNVGYELSTWEIDTDGIYLNRKGDKRWTYPFVKHIYESWGIKVDR